jgi:membrane-bound inhibitor of C-type lysozyme
MFDKNYLGHKFKRSEKYNKMYEDYICEKCDIEVAYANNRIISLNAKIVNHKFPALNLTCEEIIIKNIIE